MKGLTLHSNSWSCGAQQLQTVCQSSSVAEAPLLVRVARQRHPPVSWSCCLTGRTLEAPASRTVCQEQARGTLRGWCEAKGCTQCFLERRGCRFELRCWQQLSLTHSLLRLRRITRPLRPFSPSPLPWIFPLKTSEY